MKLIPASSARWMIRIDSSWSGSPHAPNIIAPRQRGLTFTPVVPSVRYSIQATYPALEVEQRALHRQAAAEADELAVGADHPVAGHDDGDRVAPVGQPDGARGPGRPDAPGDLAVGRGLAVGDLAQGGPYALLEGVAVGLQRELEARPLAGEVRAQLCDGRGQRRVLEALRPGLRVQLQRDQRAAARLKTERADRALIDGGVHAR